MKHQSAVHSDAEILEGTPVFVGTRVPFQTLIDYLEGGPIPGRIPRRLSHGEQGPGHRRARRG